MYTIRFMFECSLICTPSPSPIQSLQPWSIQWCSPHINPLKINVVKVLILDCTLTISKRDLLCLNLSRFRPFVLMTVIVPRWRWIWSIGGGTLERDRSIEPGTMLKSWKLKFVCVLWRFSYCLTESTLCLHYQDKPVMLKMIMAGLLVTVVLNKYTVRVKCRLFNPLKTKRRVLYLKTQFVRALNTFHLGYINQSVYDVSGPSSCLFSDEYRTHKYSVGRTYSCWMLNCWCITWPVGFKRLRRSLVPGIWRRVIWWKCTAFFIRLRHLPR